MILLPVHDYCSCIFNSSLTQTQVNTLERLQAQALKAIYGYEHSYRSLLQMTVLQTLQERRNMRSDKFVAKCLENERLTTWFQPNLPERNGLQFQEYHTRTKRLFNSPLFHMRRRLNARHWEEKWTWPWFWQLVSMLDFYLKLTMCRPSAELFCEWSQTGTFWGQFWLSGNFWGQNSRILQIWPSVLTTFLAHDILWLFFFRFLTNVTLTQPVHLMPLTLPLRTALA